MEIATVRVVAAPNLRVPKEGAPHAYITSDEHCVVPETYYYLRRLADGDLVRLPAPAVPAVKAERKAAR